MKRIHILNPFRNPFGGSEHRALDLYACLKPHAEVRLWSNEAVHPQFARRFAIGRLDRLQAPPPAGEIWIIVGAYFEAERQFAMLRPRRLVYIFNTPSPNSFRHRLALARRLTGIEPEIVYASAAGARQVGLPGRIEASPIDLQRFHPARRKEVALRRPGFVVGRVSRDTAHKHHRGDLYVYREALHKGWGLRLMGATCLAQHFPEPARRTLELLPCGAEPTERFLAGLDCFYYRVSEEWDEAFGRVVIEAMATGLPVVCDRRVGAAGVIEDGVDGYVVAGAGEALTVLRRLYADAGRRAAMGRAARRKVEAVYSAAYNAELVEFYTA